MKITSGSRGKSIKYNDRKSQCKSINVKAQRQKKYKFYDGRGSRYNNWVPHSFEQVRKIKTDLKSYLKVVVFMMEVTCGMKEDWKRVVRAKGCRKRPERDDLSGRSWWRTWFFEPALQNNLIMALFLLDVSSSNSPQLQFSPLSRLQIIRWHLRWKRSSFWLRLSEIPPNAGDEYSSSERIVALYTITRLLFERRGFRTLRAKMRFEAREHRTLKWECQVSLQLSMTPRNFISSTSLTLLSWTCWFSFVLE